MVKTKKEEDEIDVKDGQAHKPGQKFPCPTPGFADRVFYETLLRQRPDSHMAQEWCINYGVLPIEEAEKMFKIVSKRKADQKSGGASSPSPSKKHIERNVKKKKKKKKSVVEDDVAVDAEMGAGGDEGIGAATL
mmetsp:Transcript_38889/g.47388  ORF Transcript_38889/g.47388 Transcript_38889/m.47388 type:complete len:134 (-) Transcript_38889:88-489(-)